MEKIFKSFYEFINSGTSRSTAKLKPLHGAIANDIKLRLGNKYDVKSQGIGDDREHGIEGRYMSKMVDITILENEKPVAGIAVKFVMQNYSQNSNNYFENMLGETANIRSKGIPYFQIFIALDRLPYYDKNQQIKKWETFTDHNVEKYIVLSNDNIDKYYHTPNKTLIYIIHIPDCPEEIDTKDKYLDFYKQNFTIELTNKGYKTFGNSVIFNDYQTFINKVYHTIKSI